MNDYISASEIGEYLFCQRAWWYRLNGFVSARHSVLDAGTTAHEQLAQNIETVARGRQVWRILLVIGIGLLLFILFLRFMLG